MNSFLSKLIAILIAAFLFAYVIYQSYDSFYDPYVTDNASFGDYVEAVNLEGFFVRSEAEIEGEKTGIISYNYKNAQKISNNVEIASIYSSQSDLYKLREVQLLQRQKEILENASQKDRTEGIKLDLLNKQISNAKADIVSLVNGEKLTDIDEVYFELMANMIKSETYVNKEISYETTIAEIQAQIDNLQSQISESSASIISANSGYFSSVTDGLENVLDFSSVADMTVSKAVSLLEQKSTVNGTAIGKLVNESYWYFVAVVADSDLEPLSKAYHSGKSIRLKFNSKSTREVSASIERIAEDDSDNALIIFKSNFMDEDLINMRFESPQAIINTYSGIIVPKQAVRLVDNPNGEAEGEKLKGVYTMYGRSPKFKLIDVIYEDDYAVVSRVNTSVDYISGYDKVIIKGKDLDG